MKGFSKCVAGLLALGFMLFAAPLVHAQTVPWADYLPTNYSVAPSWHTPVEHPLGTNDPTLSLPGDAEYAVIDNALVDTDFLDSATAIYVDGDYGTNQTSTGPVGPRWDAWLFLYGTIDESTGRYCTLGYDVYNDTNHEPVITALGDPFCENYPL